MEQPQLTFYNLGDVVTAFSTTRHGGCSTGNYEAFNINRYCGDSETCINKNRDMLCDMLGIGNDRLIMPHQVHETKTVRIDASLLALSEDNRQAALTSGGPCSRSAELMQASLCSRLPAALEGVDALMTDLRGVCIGVSTADCIPVLLYDEAHHAVSAIHAGWRGTVKRIVAKTVEAMAKAYNTRPETLKAQIGPGIHLDSFEVGDDVYDAFSQAGFDMRKISKKYQKWHIDLPECNRQQLLALGVPPEAIAVSSVCTFKQADHYFSARRLGIHSGRIFTGILLR